MGAGGKIFEAIVVAQHGVVTRAQAQQAGFSDYEIRARLESAAWLTILPGVYRVVGGELSREACLMAAVLNAGPGAVISHNSAAYLHGFWGFRLPPEESSYFKEVKHRLDNAPIHLSVPRTSHPRAQDLLQPVSGRRLQIVTHRSQSIPEDDVRSIAGIPCTRQARTMCDLAHALSREELSRDEFAMAYEGCVIRGYWWVMKRHADELREGRPYIELLKELLDRRGPYAVRVESELEASLDDTLCLENLKGVRQHRVYDVDGKIVARLDIAFVDEQVGVEADGREHDRDPRFNADRVRDVRLHDLGYTPLHFTSKHIFHQKDYVVGTVRRFLARARVRRAGERSAAGFRP